MMTMMETISRRARAVERARLRHSRQPLRNAGLFVTLWQILVPFTAREYSATLEFRTRMKGPGRPAGNSARDSTTARMTFLTPMESEQTWICAESSVRHCLISAKGKMRPPTRFFESALSSTTSMLLPLRYSSISCAPTNPTL